LETSALMKMVLLSPSLATTASPCVEFISTIASFHPFCARSVARAKPMPIQRKFRA
jgi:hypothetical protein